MRYVVTVLALLLSISLSAQSASDTIIARERAKLQAERTGQGLTGFYLPTYLGIGQRGQLQTLLPGSAFQTTADPMFTLEEPITVRVYQSAAVATGIQKPGLSPRLVRFVRVWVRDGLDWKIAVHHGTAIGEPQENPNPVASTERPAASLPPFSGEEAAVISVQTALLEAYAKHDAITFERWTAPEFVAVIPSGEVIRRDEWLKSYVSETKNERFPAVIDDLQVRIFGDLAVASFRNLIPMTDSTVARERTTMILARTNETWRQVLAQTTTILRPRPPPEPP